MSMIDKLTILGIRSFGVHEEDRQVIEFQHPLTIIVGQNGAGKTTVIECLKYATTGDQPGNTKGGAFVHDPKLIGESEVRAQVGLKFSDIKAQVCSIKRSLQLTQKADKVTQKTLDSVITKKKGEELVSTTSKCVDINAEMVIALGVSKAVLENVIFCHQEDSNWPLSEGKVLKTKFDEIFAATRYIKALELIKITKKEHEKAHREEGTKLPFLENLRQEANEKRQKLEEHKSKLKIAEEGLRKIELEMKPVEKQLKERQSTRENILKLDMELQQHCSRQKHLQENRKSLEERIQNLFQGSDIQLQQVIQSQGRLMDQKKRKLENNQHQVDPIKCEIDAMAKRKSSLILKQGELKQEFKSFQDKKAERANLLSQASEEYGVCNTVKFEEDISETDASKFESEMKKLIRKTEETMKAKQKRMENDINDHNKEIKRVWSTKTEIEEGRKHKQKAISEKCEKKKKTTQEIRALQSSSDSDRLEELQKQLEESERELKSAEESSSVNDLKEKVKNLGELKSQHENKLRLVDQEIDSMQKHEKSRTTVVLFKKQMSEKEESVRRLKRRNVDSLSSIDMLHDGQSVDEHFPTRQSLTKWILRKTEEDKMLKKVLDKKKQDHTKFSTQLDILKKEFEKKTTRYKEIEDQMFDLCGSEDFQLELTRVHAEIKELQEGKGLTDGIQFMYKEFLKKLKGSEDRDNTPCPLCHRLFDQATEIDELADELERKLDMAPRRMLTQQQDLERKQRRYQSLLEQKPAKEEMDKLFSIDLPDIKSKISDMKEKITQLKHVIAEKEEEVRKVQDDCALAQSCSNDVSQVETTLAEVNELARKIRSEEAKLPGSRSSGKTFDSLNNDRQELKKAIDEYTRDTDRIREEIERQTNTLMSLKDNVNSLQSEKLKIASNVEKCKQLKEALKSMSDEIKTLEEQCENSELNIAPLERELKELEMKKNTATEQKEHEMSVANKQLQSIKAMHQEIKGYNERIRKYVESGKERLLQETQATSKTLESEIIMKDQKLNKLRDDIAKIEKELATCKDRQRDLDDNRALRKQDEAIAEISTIIQGMKQKLGGMDSKKLEKEIEDLSKKWHTLNRDQERTGERKKGIAENVRELQQELIKEDYKYADDRHHDCLIKVATMKLAIEDLEKYHNALDRAIMRYHTLKMAEINKIIKEIWCQTYRGNDIDHIEICSDEDTVSSSSSRRVYNYRLVKCLKGQKIDMRGRCSAGQKVLASLVIRLALAETFCINCGILALDEPTTNLDRNHIESLAGALLSIIESREKQSNFQLIVITHDEDFVELLGRSSHVDHYFRVKKMDGKSRILKCAIESLE